MTSEIKAAFAEMKRRVSEIVRGGTDPRARAGYLPPCPLCSFVGIGGFSDVIHGPSHRDFRGESKLTQCCALSATDEAFRTPAEAAAWWRARRLEPSKDLATDNRRRNTLRKLAAKDMEPIE